MKKVFYSSQYISPEWVEAHGFEPVNMVSQTHAVPQEISEGVCPYAELMLRQAEQFQGAAVIFTTRCDQMRRISELFNSANTKSFLMNIPATWQNKTSIEIYKDELKRLSRFLKGINKVEPDVKKMIELYKKEKKTCTNKVDKGKKLALMGGPTIDHDSGLIEIIRENSANICLDATETGEISVPKINLENLEKDPLSELSDAYFATMPDIAKRPNTQFYKQVGIMIRERNIEAIIIRTYPWCDIWHAEIPRIKEFFNLPVLNYTVDANTHPKKDTRLQTRLKAFFEMINTSAFLSI